MKSTDERMRDVLGRARAREAMNRRRRQRAVVLGGGVLSVIAVVLVGIGVSLSAGSSSSSDLAGQLGLMGSVLTDGSALGYIVVGLLGIVLGAAIAALAYRLGHPACGNRPKEASATRPSSPIQGGTVESVSDGDRRSA